MVSSEKRREVAERLRRFLSMSRNEHAWDHDGLQTVGSLVGTSFGENIIERLADLIDRQTCWNTYDESEMGSCTNGFRCSECGNKVEDYEGYRVSGEFNYCSKCGAIVVGRKPTRMGA